MGQTITVESRVVGDVAIFDTNRSLTGQDGVGFGSADEAAAGDDFGAELAERLFAADGDIQHVWVQSNAATVRRSGGWPGPALEAAAAVISEFFVFYRDGVAAVTLADDDQPLVEDA